MSTSARFIVTIDAGSSSVRFAIDDSATLRLCAAGAVDRMDTAAMRLIVDDADGRRVSQRLHGKGDRAALGALLDWLDRQPIVHESALIRHVRPIERLSVRVDGRTARGVVLSQVVNVKSQAKK